MCPTLTTDVILTVAFLMNSDNEPISRQHWKLSIILLVTDDILYYNLAIDLHILESSFPSEALLMDLMNLSTTQDPLYVMIFL